MQVRGPKSEQSTAAGQHAFEDGANGCWDIGRDGFEAVHCIGGDQVELGFALQAGWGVGSAG